ncbi:Mu transposase C-terminal domain-containing protein [Salipiger mucosus]|uniref:Transposase, putative n=1 Tax=Salipiger mucosus DSM 16094 TaxID=1123237 RepID=S9RE63_9RHOB|nr:Mu transposase C-terminal domain-containing protein [Salipiger mucosus]EPX76420.1 transposase, putative [Salipiger mucosus DSM 16094]
MDLKFDLDNARYALGTYDRVTIEGIAYRPTSSNEEGYVMATEAGAGLSRQFSHAQLSRLGAKGRLRHDPGYFLPDRAAKRLVASSSLVSELDPKSAARVSKKSAYVEAFRELEAEGKIKRTDKSIAENSEVLMARAVFYVRNLNPTGAGDPSKSYDFREQPSPRTMRRWLGASETFGTGGLIDAMHKRGNCSREMEPEAIGLMLEQVRGYLSRDRPTQKVIHENVQIAFRQCNEEREEDGLPPLRTPSRETVRRAIKALDPFVVKAARDGEDAARKKFRPVGDGLGLTRPLERVEIDEWTVDVITLMRATGLYDMMTEAELDAIGLDDSKRRWTLTLAICATTRCILGMVLSPSPKASAAVQVLQMVTTNKGKWSDAVGALSSWDMHGTPEQVVTDCGAAFKSEAFRNACSDLEIVFMRAAAGLPEFRGRGERIFGTIALGLCPRLAGRTFSDVVSKGDADPETRASLTLEDLSFALVRWTVDIYHNTPHSGLGGETPVACWRRLTKEWGVMPPPDMRRCRLIFGRREKRVLSKEGITMMGVRYHSKLLADWMMRKDPHKVDVRWHPKDIGTIGVRLGSDWYEIPTVFHGLEGVPAQCWLNAVNDAKASRPNATTFNLDAIVEAVHAIQQRNAEATQLAGLLVEDWGEERVAHTEQNVFLGTEFSRSEPDHPSDGEPGQAIPAPTSETSSARPSDPAAVKPRPRRGGGGFSIEEE